MGKHGCEWYPYHDGYWKCRYEGCEEMLTSDEAETRLNEYETLKRTTEILFTTAKDFVNSVREPQEPSNLAKSPAATWLFAEELRKAVDAHTDILEGKE